MTDEKHEKIARWYEDYGAQLMIYARQWNPKQQAEDIIQDSFIKLLKQRKFPENVKSWLFRVVRNESINKARIMQRQEMAGQKLWNQENNWFESRKDDLIDAQLAQNILQTLPSELREIVMLRIWAQMSLKEIAQIINKSIPWIHKEYKKALEMIKNELEKSSCTKKKT